MYYQREEAGAEAGGVHCRATIEAAGCFLLLKGVGLPMLLIRDWGLTPDVFV
jgi:hypothetical protein